MLNKLSKEVTSFNLDLFSMLSPSLRNKKGLAIKDVYLGNKGLVCRIIYKEPTGKVRRYTLTLEKDRYHV